MKPFPCGHSRRNAYRYVVKSWPRKGASWLACRKCVNARERRPYNASPDVRARKRKQAKAHLQKYRLATLMVAQLYSLARKDGL